MKSLVCLLVCFHLEKNLPVASGMGGGSANAAAALRLLLTYAPEPFGDVRLQKLALQLGADVPVCLRGEAAYMSGIGEQLTAARNIEPQYAVLVNPLVGVSTASVFKKLNAAPLPQDGEKKLDDISVFDIKIL